MANMRLYLVSYSSDEKSGIERGKMYNNADIHLMFYGANIRGVETLEWYNKGSGKHLTGLPTTRLDGPEAPDYMGAEKVTFEKNFCLFLQFLEEINRTHRDVRNINVVAIVPRYCLRLAVNLIRPELTITTEQISETFITKLRLKSEGVWEVKQINARPDEL